RPRPVEIPLQPGPLRPVHRSPAGADLLPLVAALDAARRGAAGRHRRGEGREARLLLALLGSGSQGANPGPLADATALPKERRRCRQLETLPANASGGWSPSSGSATATRARRSGAAAATAGACSRPTCSTR